MRSAISGLALSGEVSLETVAKQLDTSPRTLQRRLSRRGVNFWTLVEQSRFAIAGALLRETDLKVQDIASMTGYSTPSAFARAFAKWSNLSPSAYRNAYMGGRNGTSKWRGKGRSDAGLLVAVSGLSELPEES